MRILSRKISLVLYIIIAIVVLTLSNIGVISLWSSGIAAIANSTARFTDKNGYVIKDKYSIYIDLSDLKSNLGKELYNDGKNRITVGWIDNTGTVGSGGYRIGFRAHDNYTLNGATLISGVRHVTVNQNSFTTDMSAKMTAVYNGKTYNCSEFSTSGLNYKDGDEFGFYIFPVEAYNNHEVSLNEKGTVYLTISELYKNVWSVK